MSKKQKKARPQLADCDTMRPPEPVSLHKLREMLESAEWQFISGEIEARIKLTRDDLELQTVLTDGEGDAAKPRFASLAEQSMFLRGELASLRWLQQFPIALIRRAEEEEEDE